MAETNSHQRHQEEEANVLHAIVHGKVQGVGFRVFVRQAAMDLSVNGWVKNLSNGCVEVYAESDSELTLTELLTELYKGPPWSHVTEIDVDWRNKDHEFEGESFKILR